MYVYRICDLSRRGDIKAVADLMKGYYSDRTKNPWDMMYKDIQKYGEKQETEEDLQEILILIREAVFAALEILSFGLISEIQTPDIIQAFISEKDWNLGRRKARNLCLNIVDRLIKNGDVRYLLPSSMKREGFGFLVSRIEEIELEHFRKARPTITKGKLNLSKLEKSIIGSKFLRDQMVIETKMNADDPRIETIQEAYDLQLVELEFERTTRTRVPQDTEQITLNGQPVEVLGDEKTSSSRKRRSSEVQSPLTEFITESKSSSKKKKSSKSKRANKK
ncbi:hypothetical protein EU527_18440 [Candidatus Thorarchaeota archaeon]|nr:MAG: hypothetical protein EU527_18440 [Candidatus Thorarchaeota archaeon]